MSIPIVFTHFGKSDYLELAIHQAKFSNPDSEIYLLGDAANLYLNKYCKHEQFSKYSNCDTVLKEVYKHFSTNSYEFEYFCFKRWFVLLDFMKANNLDWVCAADSDFMLYDSVSDYLSAHLSVHNYSAGFCIPEQTYENFEWRGSGHVSLLSKQFLSAFCAFIIERYRDHFSILQNKIDFHIQNNIPGGICDMTLFYLYSLKEKEHIFNLLVPFKNMVFDNKIDSSSNYSEDEYYMKKGLKDIQFTRNKPHILSKKNEKVRFIGLHFQGFVKNRMCDFYTGKMDRIFLQLKYANFKDALKERVEKWR